MLVTERGGRLLVVESDGRNPQPIAGVPRVWAQGQGGLLDICLHPEFATNRVIYLAYAADEPDGTETRVARAVLDGRTLSELQVVFAAGPRFANQHHFGCRIVFGRDRLLYIAVGDRYIHRDQAQSLTSRYGKIFRIDADGAVPRDNPFVGRGDVDPAIYSYGHRNPQGLVVHPTTGVLWQHEHGPRGGDEINLIRAGGNYGWPRATHGVDYSGAIISEHKSLPGMIDPLWVWVPSIAPSGMAFLTGDIFPQWRGNLFVGALAGQILVRLEIDGERISREERLLRREIGRIRDVRAGPEGKIYVLTDAADGAIYRLDPA
jgi:glucose/arabinose dehydrogenase